jgi:outer membrane receptor protein involved in Fe transport
LRTAKPRRPNAGYRHLLVLPICSFFVASLSVAQTTGTVEGTVVDQSNAALPGVSVELEGPRLQGTRTAVTTASGAFRFPSVPPGAYTITASLPGLGKVQKTATVSLDATATVHLQLALTASAEVTVSGEAPLIDSTSTTTGSNYASKVINKLPVGRNYADIVFAQPGTQADFGETQARSLAISIYGSTSAENLFLIDGVNTTNVMKGFQGKDINNEFVEEVEVKTGGYQAEYGRNTGGVINVITKSGGNEFHGGVFGYYNDTGMRAEPANGMAVNYSTPGYSQAGDSQFYNYINSKDVRQEWGMDLGGFAWKDRVWFFGAYDRVQINQNIEPLDPTPSGAETFGLEFPNSYVENKYAGKITLNLFQGTSLVGSIFTDAQTQLGVIRPPPTSLDTTSYAGRQDVGGPDYGARLNQLFGSFGILTLQYAQHADRYATIPIGYNLPNIIDFTQSPTGVDGVSTGGFGPVAGSGDNNHSRREAYAGSFTAYAGNMEIKIGGDYSDDSTAGASYFTGGYRLRIFPCLQDGGANQCDLSKAPINTNPGGAPVQVFFQHNAFASGTKNDYQVIPASPFAISTKRYSGYIQDQWRVIPSLTVNLGLRYDAESFYGLDPITGPFKAFSLTSQWAPRIGFTWDFAGDGTSKLYGSVGRFYYALPTDLSAHVFSTASFAHSYNYDRNSFAQDPAAPRELDFQAGAVTGEPVDPGTREGYQDEATLGIEKAFDPTFSVGLKGTYRSLGRAVEDRCDLDQSVLPGQCAVINPGGTGPAASGAYPTCNGSGNTTDPNAGTCTTPGVPLGPARRFFRGIELMAREQFSEEVWAQASFLYSSLEGNFSGAVMESTGQTDPGINADFDYYQFTYKAFGRLELDRPIQARIDAVYNAPFGLWAGLGFYVRSGRPTTQVGWFNGSYQSALNLTTRGTAGRLPTDYDMNLSVGYDLNVGPVTITPMLYVFNLLNRQTVNDVDQFFNANGAFVTNPDSPFYGQAGVEPGTADNCPASSPAPCTDNPDYRKATQRLGPRFLRVALKITF